MCACNPLIRTPWCGKGGCQPPTAPKTFRTAELAAIWERHEKRKEAKREHYLRLFEDVILQDVDYLFAELDRLQAKIRNSELALQRYIDDLD